MKISFRTGQPALHCTLLLLVALFCAESRLVGQTTTGQINGQITDSTHSAISGATIKVVSANTGFTSETKANSDGLYVIPSLQIGSYTVTATGPGFGETTTKVTLSVDQNLRLDLSLAVGQRTEEVTVTEGTQGLETTNAEISGTFSTSQISDLPINGRDYGRFSLLTPGAVLRTSQIADITFNGMESTNNQFTIDGIDATRVDGAYMANGSERGARLLTGSLDTIAEFKTLSSNYTADYGRASGGIVNIVTKAGANMFHGGVFDFFRNDFMDAKNYFQAVGQSAPKRFNDYGANVSGPIFHDKMFFFADYEGTRQSIGIVGSGTELSPVQVANLEATQPALTPILQAMPTTTSTSNYIKGVTLTPTTDPNIVNVQFMATNRVRENLGSLRLDNIWSAKDSSFVRYNANYSSVNGPLIGVYPTAFGVNDHQLIPSITTNIAVSETHIFSPKLLNTFLAGLQEYITAFDEAESLPTITIGGLNFSPGNRGLYGREPKDIQFSDAVTWVKGKHDLKFGVGVWNIFEPFHGYISAPAVSFGSLTDFYANKVNSASISATFPNNTTRMTQIGTFITDTWQVLPNVALSLGIRWDWNQVPYDQTPASVWSVTTNSLTPVGSPYFNGYYKNFAPRIGVAWSPTPKTVFRAGYGVYIEAFQIGSFYNEITNITPGTTTLSSANIPGLSFPVTPYLSSASTALPSLSSFQPMPRNPLNNQWTLSIGAELAPKTTATIAYVGNHSTRLSVSEGINYVNPSTGSRPFPNYSNITETTWAGSSNYNALQLEVKQAITQGLTGTADFAFAHALSNQNDGGIYSQSPQQPFNLTAEYGNASNNTRENLSFNLLYQLPFGPGKPFLSSSSPVVKTLIGGWSLSGLGIVHSGIAGTVYQSTSAIGNGDTTNQRPDIRPGVSAYTSSHARLASGAVSWLNFNAFTVASGHYGNSPMGNYYGPKFAQLDVSASKDTRITESTRFELRGEFFNILNHPNFAAPSTTFSSSGAASFGVISSTVGSSIGFGTARQIQVSAKVLF